MTLRILEVQRQILPEERVMVSASATWRKICQMGPSVRQYPITTEFL